MTNRQKFANLDGAKQNDPAPSGADGTGAESGDAEGEDGGGDEGADGEAGDGGEGKKADPKYTDADVDAILEKRLARERAKMAKEIRDQIAQEAEDAKTEAQKLEGMTELQRAKHEADQLRKEKAELELKQNLSDQMAVARKELSDAGIALGDELLGMFVAPDAETTSEAIDKLKDLWPKAVNDATQAKLKRTPPPADKAPNQKSYGASFAENYTSKMNGGNTNGVQ